MGRRGPRPDDPALKHLKGDGRRPGASTPMPPDDLPELPGDFADDPDAAAEWPRLLALLERAGIPTSAWHAPSLGLYVDAYSRWRAARRLLRAEGLVVVSPRGASSPHPACRIARDSAATMGKLLHDFGVAPGSRSIAAPPVVEPEDDLDDFIREKEEFDERERADRAPRPG